MCIILSVVIFLVSKRVIKPLQELIGISRNISKGDYEARSNIKSNDEIGVLSKQFDSMAENICEKIKEL